MTASEDAMAQADQAFLEELEKVADAIRKTAEMHGIPSFICLYNFIIA